jgi:hypothetical protein
MKSAQIAAGIALAAGAGYSLYVGNTPLVIFFTSLFVVALLAPGLISRTSEVSLGGFRASFKKRIDGLPTLSDEEKTDLKKRIDGADSLDEALDIFASSTAGRTDSGE